MEQGIGIMMRNETAPKRQREKRRPLPTKTPVVKVWDTLDRVRETLGYSKERWLDVFCRTEVELFRMRSKGEMPPEDGLYCLADQLDVTYERLVAGDLDYAHLVARHQGHATHLPERYARAAFSKRRTSVHLLDMVELKYGWQSRRKLLRAANLSESVFARPDEHINIQFLMDLTEQMVEQLECSEDLLFKMGQYSVVSNYHSEIANRCRQTKSFKALYEKFILELVPHYYDQNFVYRLLSASEDSCLVECVPNSEVAEALRQKVIGNRWTCVARGGVAASVTGFLDKTYATAIEHDCIYKGGDRCIYEFRRNGP